MSPRRSRRAKRAPMRPSRKARVCNRTACRQLLLDVIPAGLWSRRRWVRNCPAIRRLIGTLLCARSRLRTASACKFHGQRVSHAATWSACGGQFALGAGCPRGFLLRYVFLIGGLLYWRARQRLHVAAAVPSSWFSRAGVLEVDVHRARPPLTAIEDIRG